MLKNQEKTLNVLKIYYILPENHLLVKPYIWPISQKLWTLFAAQKKKPPALEATGRGAGYPPASP